MEEKVLKCKASTDANKLAGSIYLAYQKNPEAKITIRVIGAGSVNQAVKATIIANKYFARKGISLALKPSFQDGEDNMTIIEMRVLLMKEEKILQQIVAGN